MTVPGLTRGALACWIAAAVALAVAVFLPTQSVVDLLGRSFNTIRNFREDFVRGFQALRIALAANAAVLALLPRLLARAEFAPSPRVSWSSEDRLPLAVLYVVPFLLAVPGLRESFQNDEWRTLREYIQNGPPVIVTRSAGDNHALYSLLAWPFVKCLGNTEMAIRLPSLLLGPLGPPLLYLILRRDQARGRAFLSAFPLSVAPFLIAYSHEGRGYAVLFPAILGLCLLQPAALAGSKRAWIAYIALGVAAAYLHIYASLAVAGLAGAAFLRAEGRTVSGRCRNVSAFFLIAGLSALLYSMILPTTLDYSARVRGLVSYRGSLDALFSELFVFPLSALWALPFAAVLAVGILQPRRVTPEAAAWILTAGLQIAVTELSGSDRAGRLYSPSLVLAWPVLSGTLSHLSVGRAAAAGLLALSLTADVTYLRLGRRDFRGAAEELSRRRKPGETLAVYFDCRPMNAYLQEPVEVLPEKELVSRAPDWFTLVDQNRILVPAVVEMADRDYQVEFRLPSARGELLGYRKKSR